MNKIKNLGMIFLVLTMYTIVSCSNQGNDQTANEQEESQADALDEASVTDQPENSADEEVPAAKDTEEGDVSGETIIDDRDGKIYPIKKYGNQIWMTKNLNFDMEGSTCFMGDPAHCERYGRLYTFEAANTACPKGWHVPSKEEWEYLIDFLGGKETSGAAMREGGGSGFGAIMAGFRDWSKEKEYYYREQQTFYWSSMESDEYNAWIFKLANITDEINEDKFDVRYEFSCRCVQD